MTNNSYGKRELTPARLSEIRAGIEAAMDEVARICDPGQQFRMSIPADPKRDSDLLIMDALTSTRYLLAEVDRLTAALDVAEKAIEQVRKIREHPTMTLDYQDVNFGYILRNYDAAKEAQK